MRYLLTYTIAFLLSAVCSAQVIDFAAPVTFTYEGEELELVLEQISERYGVKFSYSRKLIPMDMEVYVDVQAETFSDALDALFYGTPIIYGFIGNQLVLSIDADKQIQHPMRQEMLDEPIASTEPIYIPRQRFNVTPIRETYGGFSPELPDVDTEVYSKEFIRYESDRLMRLAEDDYNAFRAQITLVPPLTAISSRYSNSPVNLSFNVLVGVNDRIEGLEMGGIANVVRGNMEGVQMAGVANAVRQSIFGAQMAGVTNIVREPSTGGQIAGVANVAQQGGDVVQVAGVANVAGGRSLAQISAVFNHCEEVDGVQVSALVNVAKRTNAQVGIFNFADTSNFSIGILSFIKTGYHAFSVAGEDVLHLNANLRLGTRSFYNILHASTTYDFTSWALGYGIGTMVPIGHKRNFVRLELLSRHVNENEDWTSDLNLLSQFNIFWDFAIGRHFSIDFGPSVNVFASRLYNADTDSYGSQLPNYTVFDETWKATEKRPVNLKGWIGFHLGFNYNF